MSSAYETWATKLRAAFMGPKGRALLGAIASVVGDQAVDESMAATLEHLPLNAQDVASLALHASERQIEPGPTETMSANLPHLAARIANARWQWKLAGAPIGLLYAIYMAELFPDVIVQQNGLAYSITVNPDPNSIIDLAAAPTWFQVTTLNNNNPTIPASTDGKPAVPAFTIPWFSLPRYNNDGGNAAMDAEGNQFNSRFLIIFITDPPHLNIADNLNRLRRVIAEWRDVRATCVGIVDATAGPNLWGYPQRKWGSTDKWSAGTVHFYTP